MKAITTKFYGPGNVRGSRIVASDSDKNRVTSHCLDELDMEGNHDAAARKLCLKMGWTRDPLMRGSLGPTTRVYVFDQHVSRVRFTEAEQKLIETRKMEAFERDRAKRIAQYEAEDKAKTAHPKVTTGQCPTCGHYGSDCTGTEEGN